MTVQASITSGSLVLVLDPTQLPQGPAGAAGPPGPPGVAGSSPSAASVVALITSTPTALASLATAVAAQLASSASVIDLQALATEVAPLVETAIQTTPPTHPATFTPSPSGSTVPPLGSITDSTGIIWSLIPSKTLGNQIAKDGVVDPVTQQVAELAYVNSVVWQKNQNNLWWSWVNNTWTPPAGTAVSPLN